MTDFMIIYGLEKVFKMQPVDYVMYFLFFVSSYLFVAIISFAMGSFYNNYKHEKKEN